MKQLYLKIIAKLTSQESKDLFTSRGLKPVKFIDLYMSQEQDEQSFELMTLPAVLFEWDIEKNENPNEGKAKADITLHLLYEQNRETNHLAKALPKALKVFDHIDTVNELMQGLASEDTGGLDYESEKVIQLAPIVNMISINYTCAYYGKIKSVCSDYIFSDGDASLEIDGQLVQSFFDIEE